MKRLYFTLMLCVLLVPASACLHAQDSTFSSGPHIALPPGAPGLLHGVGHEY